MAMPRSPAVGLVVKDGAVAACREQVGAGVGVGEEAEASPFGELGGGTSPDAA